MKKSTGIILIIMLLGLVVISMAIVANMIFNLTLTQNLIMGWILTILYAVFALSLTGRTRIYSGRTKIREVIKEVDRPVLREVIKEVDRPVYIEEKRERLVIPKYNYAASTQTKTYHKRNCRLGKLIKKKFKLQNNSETFFTRRKYKPCRVCIKNKK
jgi:hypothetical protein